jgi:hypothetical protein
MCFYSNNMYPYILDFVRCSVLGRKHAPTNSHHIHTFARFSSCSPLECSSHMSAIRRARARSSLTHTGMVLQRSRFSFRGRQSRARLVSQGHQGFLFCCPLSLYRTHPHRIVALEHACMHTCTHVRESSLRASVSAAVTRLFTLPQLLLCLQSCLTPVCSRSCQVPWRQQPEQPQFRRLRTHPSLHRDVRTVCMYAYMHTHTYTYCTYT